MTKLLPIALQAVADMKRFPVYVIAAQPDGTCQILRRDKDDITERFYEKLTHEEAGQLADALNTYRDKEFGWAE